MIEIGEEINLCEKTISNRKTAILKNLNLKNDIELVKYAIRNNLTSLE
jgi:DNA-binding NarL/FixJ family response regulator